MGAPSQSNYAFYARVGATAAQPDWSTVDFVDLVRQVKGDCLFQDKLVTCAGPLRIDALTKTRVLGHGVRLEFSDSRPGMGGILLNDAKNVIWSDMEIGWLGGGANDPVLPGIQRLQSFGNVAACPGSETGGMLVMDLPLEGTLPINTVSIWDNTRGWPWYPSAPDDFEVYFPNNTTASFRSGRSNCISQLVNLRGHRVLVRHLYTNHAFGCNSCNNVTIEKVRITSAPGMAFVFGGGGAHFTLRENVIEPQCSPFCAEPEPSVFADGAHFAGVAGDILIEKNDFGWNGDDSVNVTALLVPIQSVVEQKNDGLPLYVENKWWGDRGWELTLGAKYIIYTQGLSRLGEGIIAQINPITKHFKFTSASYDANNLVIVRADTIPVHVVVRNNKFHDHRARGILMGGSDALIIDNSIQRVTMEAIIVGADTFSAYEGPGGQRVIIQGNRISSVNRYSNVTYPSAISAGVLISKQYAGAVGAPIKDVLVKGNSISDVYSHADKIVSFGPGVSSGQAIGDEVR